MSEQTTGYKQYWCTGCQQHFDGRFCDKCDGLGRKLPPTPIEGDGMTDAAALERAREIMNEGDFDAVVSLLLDNARLSSSPRGTGEDSERLLLAGGMLANCAYNLAQRDHLTPDERRSLDDARKAWDAIVREVPMREPCETCGHCHNTPADCGHRYVNWQGVGYGNCSCTEFAARTAEHAP